MKSAWLDAHWKTVLFIMLAGLSPCLIAYSVAVGAYDNAAFVFSAALFTTIFAAPAVAKH